MENIWRKKKRDDVAIDLWRFNDRRSFEQYDWFGAKILVADIERHAYVSSSINSAQFPNIMSLLSEIPSKAISTQIDLARALSDAKSSEKPMVFTDMVVDKKPIVAKLKGYLTTDAIQVSQYGHHSIGFSFCESEDLELFQKLSEVLDTISELRGWELGDLVKNDRLYLKLKHKNNRYLVRSNVKLEPKKAENAPIYRYQNVDVDVEVKAWFNVADKKCALYLEVRSLYFEKDSPPSPKKSRRN